MCLRMYGWVGSRTQIFCHSYAFTHTIFLRWWRERKKGEEKKRARERAPQHPRMVKVCAGPILAMIVARESYRQSAGLCGARLASSALSVVVVAGWPCWWLVRCCWSNRAYPFQGPGIGRRVSVCVCPWACAQLSR